MNKKILITIIALAMVAAFISTAKAQIKATITVKDSKGNVISGGTVHINTVAYVYGHYEDLAGHSPASGQMDVYFDDGLGLNYKATIWSGNLNDGGTVMRTYTMSELGTYEFRMTCQIGTPETLGTLRCTERVQARTTIQLVVPEPGTLAGLAMALAAFGFLAVKKARSKIGH
jgi:hypothetical protein